MDATGSLAVLRRVLFLGPFVSGLTSFAMRYLQRTRLTMEAITTDLRALGKDAQTEDEQGRMSTLAMTLYRYSE